MDDKYRGAPLRTTPEARERADRTLRSIYGTKVKIPPPGAERDQLIARVRKAAHGEMVRANYKCDPTLTEVAFVIQALEEELG